MHIRTALLLLLVAGWFSAAHAQTKPTGAKPQKPAAARPAAPRNPYYSRTDTTRLRLTDAQWQKVLSPDVYRVARGKYTERAFTGKYWNANSRGTYYCAACGNALFRSDAKFASDCGWPSFFEPMRAKSVKYLPDNSHGMERIEVVCGRCDSHLGHIFDDGPAPTYKRFCMNSIVLDFVPGSGASFGLR